MKTKALPLATLAAALLAGCGGSTAVTAPGAPRNVSVAAGATAGTATVRFDAPATGDAPTGYTVTVSPGGIVASGAASPITVTGLAARTGHTYTVTATNGGGTSPGAATGVLRFYAVVETFHEPMTQPNDTLFTGTFTFDATAKVVSNLAGSLTQSMTKVNGVYGPPMTTRALTRQLDATAATLGGVQGLLVTTFFLDTVNTFVGGGFAPGGTEYYGYPDLPSPASGGVGNAYAMIFVPTTDPTAAIAQAQLDKLAYADCTMGGIMMSKTCMTGTTVAGYGKKGTMMGEPVSQVITEQ